MKKILGIITFIFCAIIITINGNVNAETGSLGIECDTKSGAEHDTHTYDVIACYIHTMTPEVDYNKTENTDIEVRVKYDLGDSFVFTSYEFGDDWDEIVKVDSGYILKSKSGKPSNFGTLYMQVKEGHYGKKSFKISISGDVSYEEEFEYNIWEDDDAFYELTNIEIENYTLNFDKDVHEYKLKIKDDETELDITPITQTGVLSYEITGNYDLKDGSIIYIESYGKNFVTEYTIEIEKDDNKKSNQETIKDSQYLLYSVLANGLLLVTNITTIVIVCKKSKKQNNNF